MRIALIRRRFSATGGAENYLERLAYELQLRGHEITLVCEQWKRSDTAITSVRTVATNDPADFARAIGTLKLKNEFDLVFSLERVPGCDLYRAGDGVHAEWLELRTRYSPLLGPLRNSLNPKNGTINRIERKLYRPENTGRIIANSNMVKNSILTRFGYPADRIDVVYNGVQFEKFSNGDRAAGRRVLGLSAQAYVVLLVGAGEERKGVRFARKAVERVKGAQLVVIDKPVTTPLPDIYAAADVFLLPTIYDPFANVTLEALAAGLPVITTIHNGASEILSHEKDGFILQRADDLVFISKYLERLRDPQLRAKFKKSSQIIAAEHDISININETLAVIEQIQRVES